MYQDSSAVMSFPATVSVDNRGSVLPDAFNTGDALERYGQVSQKVMPFGFICISMSIVGILWTGLNKYVIGQSKL
jgi:hypothetical protein